MSRRLAVLVLVLALVLGAGPAAAVTYQIRYSAFASAGGAPVTVGSVRLGQSAGQSVTGAGEHATAPKFAESAGYWHWAGPFPLVGVEPPGPVPEVLAFALEPGAPTPFEHSTAIRYALPTETGSVPVALKVYDLSGRLVRVLDQGTREAGVHRVNWDGTDGAGHLLGGGVYFAHITAGPYAATRRLVLTR